MDHALPHSGHQEIGLLDGLATTRAIRRYTDAEVTDEQLNQVLFAASRAPSGSNRQLFRFIVLRDDDASKPARELLAQGARKIWGAKKTADKYDRTSSTESGALSPKARMAATMEHYVDNFAAAPVIILPCLIRHRDPTPTEGASVYPAVQNLLLAARAIGLGGALTSMHLPVEAELRELLGIPDEVLLAATMTLGQPQGSHGPVRRQPLSHFVFESTWGAQPAWVEDPPGTTFTQAGPPTTN